jgi:hypothetical protein
MTAEARYVSKRLLTIFQKTWAERDALRLKHKIESSGHPANWEEILPACQTRAQELFQPALLDLDNGRAIVQVLEKLLEQLEGAQ